MKFAANTIIIVETAPAVEVGIVTARGGGYSLDHCLLVIFV